MFNMNVKMKFIELKAAGMPMYKIADEIGVHRVTLMRWNKELAAYILIAKQDVVDELLLENNCIKIKRTEAVSRHLAAMYDALDKFAGQPDKSAEYGKTLDNITKLTRLLMMETNCKGPESVLLEKQDTEKESAGITGALWVTDREKFEVYANGDSSKNVKEIEEFKSDLEMKPNELLHSNGESIQDISERDPMIQEIFKKSIKRNAADVMPEIVEHMQPKQTIYQDYAM